MSREDGQVRIEFGDGLRMLGARLPDGLRGALKAAATANGRSTNAEIVARLDASFDAGRLSLDSEIAAVIRRHIQAEVARRLGAIAAQITGPTITDGHGWEGDPK